VTRYNLSVAGKVMAYIALGTVREELMGMFKEAYQTYYLEPVKEVARKFSDQIKRSVHGLGVTDEDILASFHIFLERMLIENLKEKLMGWRVPGPKNLCFVGGCALNIKWNSAIRNSGLFDHVWVPPFTNDTGSAIGTACCALFKKTEIQSLEWDVYKGPRLSASDPGQGWAQRPCTIEALAELLHVKNEPVVFLHGRSEVGPRALGNRSIIAAAVSPYMKDILNKVKAREAYRPVAPICLEEESPLVFNPGCPDPYMLFDHRIHDNWSNRIPAVVHLDGTARVQTVNDRENPAIVKLLREYQKLSGIPLLCNTSANLNGCGFFPDVHSATKWGQVNYVWCEETLYEKRDKVEFFR
jgi:carbamoyltransferase